MVGRAEPLVVDILVAALAGIGFHEELAGNLLLAVYLRRTGKKRPFGSVAFAVHGFRGHGGILNAAARLPTFPHVVRAIAERSEHGKTDCDARDPGEHADVALLGFLCASSAQRI